MTNEEKQDYEILQENENYLFDYLEILHKTIAADPNKWQTFINLTSPLMAKTLEQIISEGPDPRWTA